MFVVYRLLFVEVEAEVRLKLTKINIDTTDFAPVM